MCTTGHEYTLNNGMLPFEGLLRMSRLGPVQDSYGDMELPRQMIPGIRPAQAGGADRAMRAGCKNVSNSLHLMIHDKSQQQLTTGLSISPFRLR